MFKVSGLWGALGVALTLIALYLVLEHGGGASQVFGAFASGTSKIFSTLQGR